MHSLMCRAKFDIVDFNIAGPSKLVVSVMHFAKPKKSAATDAASMQLIKAFLQ